MTVNDLLKHNFEKIFPSILKNPKSDLVFEDLIDTENSVIVKSICDLSLGDGVNQEEKKSLIDFLNLMEDSELVVYDYDEVIQKRFEQFIERYNLPSFKFILIRYRTHYFYDEGIHPELRADFYKNLFREYADIICLEDFFEVSEALNPILLNNDNPDYFIPIFKQALDNFPQKSILKYILARLFEKNGELGNTIEYCMQFLGQVESDRNYNIKSKTYVYHGDSITIEDYIIGLHMAANLFFQNEQFTESLDYCDQLLDQYQGNSEDVYSFTISWYDPMILRCKIHMKLKNSDAFLADFKKIKNVEDEEVLISAPYSELVKYSKSLET
jgi:tetratricopeptide (TPR) repeat protein